MKVDESRLERQKLCIKDVVRDLKTCGKACINACPGFGKTYMITELVFKRLYESNKNLEFITLVGSDYLKEQWLDRSNNLTKVFTWQTIYKEAKQSIKCDFLIIDEIHNLILTPKYIRALSVIEYKYLIVMSGTLDNRHLEKLKQLGIPISHIVTEKEAIENGWLNKKHEFNLAIEISYGDSVKYNTLCDKYREAALFIDENVDNPDTSKQWESFDSISFVNKYEFGGYITKEGNRLDIPKSSYNQYKAQIKHYKTGKNAGKPYEYKNYYNAARVARMRGCSVEMIIGKATEASKTFSARATLCQTNDKKIEVIKEFINLFPNRKIVTFSTQTNFADKIAKEINGVSYHGKMNSKQLKEALDLFLSGNLKSLHTVGKIKEGADIPTIDTAINCSTYSKWTDKSQKDARAGRIEEDKKETIVLNLYCVLHKAFSYKPTFEKYFLEKAQINKEVHWIKNIEEIWQKLNTQ